MTVGIVGSGPVATAVRDGLTAVNIETRTIDVAALDEPNIAVVTGEVGQPRFERANERALATDSRWMAVEVGGIGGMPVVETSVSTFSPETGCFECLSGRVSANLDRQQRRESPPTAHTVQFAGAVAARQIALYHDGEDVFGTVVTTPFTQRDFLPLPNCVCAADRERTIERDVVDRELTESLSRAERGLDGLVGIVQEVGEAESFPVPYYLARACDTAGFSDASAARDAAGVAVDWNRAFMKALGEALERYCAGIYYDDEFEIAPPEAMAEALSPSAFVTATDPDPTEPIEWVDGHQLRTGDVTPLPAEFVYHPPPSRRYRSPVTTGLGLGNDTVEAILAGLYEVIERDAMMLSWYSSFEPLGLQIEDETHETMVNRARSEGLSVETLLLSQDVDVPVVAAAVTREEWPRMALGTGANLDVAAAANSALAEALQNWTELRGMGESDAMDAMGSIGDYAAEPEPASAFVDPGATVPGESVGPETVPDGEAELDAVLDRLADVSLEAYAVRLTTRDVKALGFEAVRTLIPRAQPLTFGSHYFGERARTVPEELGFETQLDRAHHPFP